MTNEKRCLLSNMCKFAGTERCNNNCIPFVSMHGTSGNTGRVGMAEIPDEYRLVTLDNSPARHEQAVNYERLRSAYIPTFKRQLNEVETPKDRIKNIYLYSKEPGTGKTTTACALLNEWMRHHYVLSIKAGRQPEQVPGYFLDVNEWQTLYNQFNRDGIPREIKEEASAEYYRKMNLAKTAPFVVLDDVGVRSATDGFRGDLHSVINHRVSRKLITVFTSNVEIKDLMQVYDPRLYDRIRDLTLIMDFKGASKRGKR
jgi:DNA replication protein DnaC